MSPARPRVPLGSAVEKQGIIRHGAKMLFAVAEATVAKVTVVLPVMGPEGAVNIIFRKQIEQAPPDRQDDVRNRLIDTVREQIGPYIAAGWSFVDDLIDPADTRATILRGLELGESKRVDRPWRKHGVPPV